MATITFQVAEAGQTTATKVYTLPDANIDLLVNAYQQLGNTSVNGTATRAQVLLAWVQQIINNTVSTVTAYQQSTAIAALPTVVPIAPV